MDNSGSSSNSSSRSSNDSRMVVVVALTEDRSNYNTCWLAGISRADARAR